jgi:hypothetical protein
MMEELERRTLLSVAPQGHDLVSSTSSTAPAAITLSTSAAPDLMTHGQRQELLLHLANPLQPSLGRTLRHSGDAAFDASLLDYILHRDGINYFYRPKSLSGLVDWINTYLGGRADKDVVKADAILAHKFPEQVSSDEYAIQLPAGEIDWGRQPTTTDNPGFLHALNRHGYWRELGMAWQLTSDPRYVRELVAELKSWSDQTPALSNPDDWPSHATQWSPLDTADRVRNWIETYYRVLGAPAWTPAANSLFLYRLFDQGDFLSRVTPSAYTKNRTAVHAAALVRIGILFPEFTDAPVWEYHGFDMTFRCLGAQFYPDGGHVEETPAYEAATANAMFEDFYLAQLNGRTNWTRNRRKRLQNAIGSLYQLLNPNGSMPGLSDTYRSSDSRPFIFRAGFVFGDARWKKASRPTIEDVLLIGPKRIGLQPLNQDDRLADRGPAFAMPDSGYYILRGAEYQLGGAKYTDTQLILDAGPKGGGHGHFDLLSFEFQEDAPYVLIPDPGPYLYDDSADRQYVISTPAHNTISIDGLNHRAIEGAGNPNIVVDEFWSDEDEARVTAHHYAYDDLTGRPTVARTLWIERRVNEPAVMLAVDWVRSDAPHTFTTSFNLASLFDSGIPNVQRSGTGLVDVQLSKTRHMRVQSLEVPGQSEDLIDAFISSQPPPNSKTPSKRLAISQSGESALFVTLMSSFVTSKKSGQVVSAPVSAEFEAPPQTGQTVQIKLTYPDGSTRSLTFAPPDLSPRQ